MESMHFSLSYLCYIVELGSLPSVEFYVPFSSARFLCDLHCALVLWSLARSPIGCKQLWQKLISILEFCFIPIIFFSLINCIAGNYCLGAKLIIPEMEHSL